MILREATMKTITADDPNPIAQAQDLPSVRAANLPIILQRCLSLKLKDLRRCKTPAISCHAAYFYFVSYYSL